MNLDKFYGVKWKTCKQFNYTVTRLQKFLPWLRKSFRLWGICSDILFAKEPSASGAQHIIPKKFLSGTQRCVYCRGKSKPDEFQISIEIPDLMFGDTSPHGPTGNFYWCSHRRTDLRRISRLYVFFFSPDPSEKYLWKWDFFPIFLFPGHLFLRYIVILYRISHFLCLPNRVVLFMHLIIHWSKFANLALQLWFFIYFYYT